MSNWIECPTCATDFDLDSIGWDDGTIDDTVKAFELAEAAPDLLERVKVLETTLKDCRHDLVHLVEFKAVGQDVVDDTINEIDLVLKETE